MCVCLQRSLRVIRFHARDPSTIPAKIRRRRSASSAECQEVAADLTSSSNPKRELLISELAKMDEATVSWYMHRTSQNRETMFQLIHADLAAREG